jgi:SAM-dependent methyltransferase
MTTTQSHPIHLSGPDGAACPSCGGRALQPFHRVDGVPAHACLLMPSPGHARRYPRGDLRLAFCRDCGFITNTAFDPLLLNYSEEYEETQGYSPTFTGFARRLAGSVIDRYDLRGKRALEIGCGKGEFITLLCELGMAGGVGIDPAYIPGRLENPAARKVEFIQDFYSPAYSFLTADLICCRHTLEHIAPTLEFLQTIRDSIGSRRDTVLLFELPDVLRVLREPAFWDIYYEHCSYFSPGSLARVFRLAGFEVADLWMDYADQYILIAARPAEPGADGAPLQLEEDVAEIARSVEEFRDTCPTAMSRWREFLARGRALDQRTAIWGSGSKGVSFLTTLGVRDEIDCVVDINPRKHGRFMPGSGHRIVGPETLRESRPDRVIVMNPVYIPEIRAQLHQMGLHPEIVSV